MASRTSGSSRTHAERTRIAGISSGCRRSRHDRPPSTRGTTAQDDSAGSLGFKWERAPIEAPFVCSAAIWLQSSRENWSGWPDSNRRPPDPQSGALSRLRYIPYSVGERRTSNGYVRFRGAWGTRADPFLAVAALPRAGFARLAAPACARRGAGGSGGASRKSSPPRAPDSRSRIDRSPRLTALKSGKAPPM